MKLGIAREEETMKADAKTEDAVLATLYKFAEAYTKRDLDGVLALFAPDPDMVLIGSGADEKRVGLAQLKVQAERDWSQSEAFSWEIGWHSVSMAGSVAWVATDIIANAKVGGEEMSFPMRFTAVLEQRGDRWLFVQCHASVPAAGQTEGKSFAT